MYDNIGDKIKGVSGVVCALGMIASAIAGVVLMINDVFLFGLLVLVVGCLCSWLGSLIPYGFGELIEETKRSRLLSEKLLNAMEPKR